MNPTALQRFSEALALAVLQAVPILQPDLHGETAEEWAVNTTLALLDQVQRRGIQGIEHYGINTCGGALRLVCTALGLPNIRALEDFLE